MPSMKNRYCLRTKLSEEVFLKILGGFCAGMTATEAHGILGELGDKVSRQTVETKFLELGNYFYKKWTRPSFVSMMREANPGTTLPDVDLEIMCLHMLWVELRGQTGYKELREQKMPRPGPAELIDALTARWKAFNGFTKDTFKSQLGFAFYAIRPQVKQNPEAGYKVVMAALERDPLDPQTVTEHDKSYAIWINEEDLPGEEFPPDDEPFVALVPETTTAYGVDMDLQTRADPDAPDKA
jgi:hypothetical protein